MKPFFLITYLLLIVTCSENRHIRANLDLAESSMSSAPDSALALVRGIDGQSLPTKSLRARHALLLTMAQDKCYFDIDEDSTILMAYDYYQHHGGRRERLLATYYLGVIRQNAKEYIPAALAFREAEPLAEDVKDYRQLSLIEQHLSRIFAGNYDHVRALEYAEKALNAAEKARESLMADYCRLDMANQYLAKSDYSHATELLNKVLDSGSDNNDLRYHALLAMVRSVLYNPGSDKRVAKEIIEEIQKIRKPEMLERSILYLTNLAIVYETEGEHNLSNKCLEMASSRLYSPIDSVRYWGALGYIMEARGEWEQAHKALSLTVKSQDRIITELLDQSVTHSMEQFFSDKWEIERIRHNSHLFLFVLIVVVLFIVIVSLFFLLNKKNRQLLDDMARIQEVSEDLLRLRKNHSASYELVDKFIADKVRVLQQLSESYFSWDDTALKKLENKKGRLMKEDVIVSFRKQLGELRGDQSIISALEQSLDVSENDLMKKARSVLKNEKELDYTVLTMLFSGFSIKSISYLLRMSESSLRMRKTRFKQQFETLSEPFRSLFLNKIG